MVLEVSGFGCADAAEAARAFLDDAELSCAPMMASRASRSEEGSVEE